MGIYISGMEMPKCCASCKIKKRNGGKMVCPLCNEEWDIHDPMSADFRLDSCPLVPVPPHGRLGDLDRMLADNEIYYNRLGRQDGEIGARYRSVKKSIELAPTVIPPEK